MVFSVLQTYFLQCAVQQTVGIIRVFLVLFLLNLTQNVQIFINSASFSFIFFKKKQDSDLPKSEIISGPHWIFRGKCTSRTTEIS